MCKFERSPSGHLLNTSCLTFPRVYPGSKPIVFRFPESSKNVTFILGSTWCTDAGGWFAIGDWADSGWYSTLGVISAGGRKVSCCVTSVGVALGGREAAVLVMLLVPWILLDPRCEIQPHPRRLRQIPEAQTCNTSGLDQLILKT